MINPNQIIVQLALAEVGNREEPPGSNRGPRVQVYQAATALAATQPTGWPWCASFVSFILQHALPQIDPLTAAPREASVYGLEDFCERAPGYELFQPQDQAPRPGDIVLYRFSHVEFVLSAGEASFQSVGGNTGDAVAIRTRSYALVRRFIRVVPRAQGVA